jgi:hypothetical protein
MAYPRDGISSQVFLRTYDYYGLWGHSIFYAQIVGFAAVTATFSVVPLIERTWMYWIVFVVGVLAQWSITCSQSKR